MTEHGAQLVQCLSRRVGIVRGRRKGAIGYIDDDANTERRIVVELAKRIDHQRRCELLRQSRARRTAVIGRHPTDDLTLVHVIANGPHDADSHSRAEGEAREVTYVDVDEIARFASDEHGCIGRKRHRSPRGDGEALDAVPHALGCRVGRVPDEPEHALHAHEPERSNEIDQEKDDRDDKETAAPETTILGRTPSSRTRPSSRTAARMYAVNRTNIGNARRMGAFFR